MESSILKSTKKILGVAPEDPTFDLDIITHVNSAFSNLNQLGIGPVDGFRIEDDVAEWTDFLGEMNRVDSVKTFVYLYVRNIFDPPATSYAINAIKEELTQLAWRINVDREGDAWADPDPPVGVVEDE